MFCGYLRGTKIRIKRQCRCAKKFNTNNAFKMNSRIIVVVLAICRLADAEQSGTSEMFAEGLSSNATKVSRIVGRKGAENPHDENSIDDVVQGNGTRMEHFEPTEGTEISSNTSKKKLPPELLNKVSMASQNDDQKHQLFHLTTPSTTTLGTKKYANGSGELKINYIILSTCLVLAILIIAVAIVVYRKMNNWMVERHYTRVVCRLKSCSRRNFLDLYCVFSGLSSRGDIRQLM